MTDLLNLWNIVLSSIQAIGYIQFAIIVVIDILLWRVHPVLGLIGTLITFAYLVNWI